MARKPREIRIERHAKPHSHCVAWTAEPKASAFTGLVSSEEKARALRELHGAIRQDGCDPLACEIVWAYIEEGWGWIARVREPA